MNMKALLALVLSSALTAPAFATAPNAAAPKGGNFVIILAVSHQHFTQSQALICTRLTCKLMFAKVC